MTGSSAGLVCGAPHGGPPRSNQGAKAAQLAAVAHGAPGPPRTRIVEKDQEPGGRCSKVLGPSNQGGLATRPPASTAVGSISNAMAMGFHGRLRRLRTAGVSLKLDRAWSARMHRKQEGSGESVIAYPKLRSIF
jgi:hypothetical protein